MNKLFGCLIAPFAVILAPLWMPILAFEWNFIPSEILLKERMKRRRRYLKKENIPEGGSFIIDFPTFNWGLCRIWWTPEDILTLAPVKPPERDLGDITSRVLSTDEKSVSIHAIRGQEGNQFKWSDFDKWCTERYLDEKNGSAMVVAVWHAQKLHDALKKRYPNSLFISSFSGGKQLELFYAGA